MAAATAAMQFASNNPELTKSVATGGMGLIALIICVCCCACILFCGSSCLGVYKGCKDNNSDLHTFNKAWWWWVIACVTCPCFPCLLMLKIVAMMACSAT
jgi:hypothetical protein